ncbi:hypothetical protein HGK75_03875 [uncultured bacterium]|nr:hypothetical protein HGK75_03875 [uncultured bacterium]
MDLSKSTTIIKGLLIKKRGRQAVLDTRNVFNLMARPNLKLIGTDKIMKTLPQPGDIVKIRTRYGLRSLVVVTDHPKSLAFHSRIKSVYAGTQEHLMDPVIIKQFKSYMAKEHLPMPKMDHQMIVIRGYHYGIQHKKPFVNTTKPYNFKVTNLTNHFEWMKAGCSASVLTKRGKSLLIIHDIKTIDDPAEQKKAMQYQPVISFHNYGIKNNWIANIYKKVILDKDSDK